MIENSKQYCILHPHTQLTYSIATCQLLEKLQWVWPVCRWQMLVAMATKLQLHVTCA